MHPVRFGLKVGAFLEVNGHVEGLASEQIKAETHVLTLPKFTANVHGKRMHEIVHRTPEVNDVTEEEGQCFNTLFFAEGGQLKPFGINV